MKHNIPALIKTRKLFFISFLFVLVTTVAMMFIYGNNLMVQHSFWPNVFFVNYTFMGDAVFAICLAVFFTFYLKRRQQGMVLFYGFFLTEIIVQVIKNIESFPVPDLFSEQGQYLFLTDSTSSADHTSMISGHTAIAFSLATVLIFTLNNSITQLSLLIGSVLLAYSRIYLAQHGLVDVLIGAVTGTISAIVAVHIAYQFKGYGYYYSKFQRLNNNETSKEMNVRPI